MQFIKYIFIVLFLSVNLVSQAKVTIHGKILDEESQPLEFVTIRIDGTAIGVTSDLNGDYSISTTEQDTLKVVYSCIGYKEVTKKLVNPQGDITLNLKMSVNSQVLQEVSVTEYRKQMGAMQKIDSETFKLSPDVSGGSVEAMLTTMAGVNSTNEMSSQYSVRGGTFDENSVYINGIEIYRPQLISSGQQEGLSIINPDLVDNISFSTGGFPAEYCDKMSSVLDITYKEPQTFEGAVSLSLMGGSVSIGQSSKKFSQIHGFRYKSNSSLLSSMETKGEYDPKYFDYQTNLNLKLNSKFKLSFLGNIAINNYSFKPINRTTNFGTSTDAKQFKVYFDGQEKDKFETYFGALSLNYTLSKSIGFSLVASGYMTNELVSYDISGEYWLDQAGTTGGSNPGNAIGGELGVGRYHEHSRNRLKASVFSVALRGHIGINKHNINYGLSFNRENIFDRTREWELRDSAGYSLPVNGTSVNMVYNLTSNHDIATTRLSFFAQDSYRLPISIGYFTFNGGVRLSYWDFNKEFLISPRVNVAYVPKRNERWAFRFASGLYYQSPFYKEYRQPIQDEKGNYTIKLNDEILSQRSIQFILGSDYTFRAFNRPFKFSAEAYYKLLGNLIPYEVDNLKITYSGVNSSKGFTAGIDCKLFGQFVPGTDSWVSFSLMKTQEELNGVKVPRPTDQRYSFALFFTDYFPKFPKLKFSLRGIFSDGLPTTAPRSTRDQGYFRAPAYKRVDVGLSYALLSPLKEGENRYGFLKNFKSIWLGIDVFNLLDISNVSSYYWVTDVNNLQYAVPNYLTRRQFNVRLSIDF